MPPADPPAAEKSLRDRATKILQGDYFAALDLPRTAKTEDITKAYVAAAKIFHPDRAPSEELRPLLTKVFARLDLAKTTLADPDRRARYLGDLAKSAVAAEDATVREALLEFKKAEGLLKKNANEEAEQHLRRAVKLAPANADYATLLVWVQVKADTSIGRLRELVSDLDRLLDRNPQSERALYYRGHIKQRLGMHSGALTDFTQAFELNPSNIEAAREVRLYKMRAGEKEKQETTDGDSGVGGFFRKLFKR